MRPIIAHERCILFHGDSAELNLPANSVDAIVCDPPAGIGFMSKEWDGDRGGSKYPRGFGAWLAGFIDGEGNFDIHKQQRDSGDYYYCRFELTLRADDGAVLQMLQSMLGGKVYYGESSTENGNPRARWELVSRAECATLVALLDGNHMQTKKARDFAIWREALAVSTANAGTSMPHLMEPFWHQLRGTRPYGGKVTEPSVFREMAHEHAWIAWLAKTLGPAFRALKPGGHALVWALPRTSHWTALALEAAGFEIRDRVSHLFGTGFPKSLNVSKAIDAHLGKERPVVGQCTNGAGNTDNSIYKTESGGYARSREKVYDITGAGSTEAENWEGWGTALKPACEDWWLVRKPLEGTVARNVLQYGTGGLNIDACRVDGGARPKIDGRIDTGASHGPDEGYGTISGGSRCVGTTTEGRWPAHVVLDEEAAALLDQQSGIAKPKPGSKHLHKASDSIGTFKTKDRVTTNPDDAGGGASRFFYVAKGSRSEKDAGLAHLTPKTAGEATDREENTAGLQNPRAGAGRTGGARNFHPTVKSIALMRWLVRLITPPGGVVLDPFAGSGSTGVAALAEGFSFIGVEFTEDYIPIIEGRLRHALVDS